MTSWAKSLSQILVESIGEGGTTVMNSHETGTLEIVIA